MFLVVITIIVLSEEKQGTKLYAYIMKWQHRVFISTRICNSVLELGDSQPFTASHFLNQPVSCLSVCHLYTPTNSSIIQFSFNCKWQTLKLNKKKKEDLLVHKNLEIYWVELVLRKFRLKHPNWMILSGLSFSLILSLPLSCLLSPSFVCFSFVLFFRHTFPHIKARVHGQPDAGLSCFSVRVPWLTALAKVPERSSLG